MTVEDDEIFPRMYEGIEAFVSKFNSGTLHIKEQGRSLEMKNPLDGKKTNLTTLIGYLVPTYVRFADAVKAVKKEIPSNPEEYVPMYLDACKKRLKTATALSQTIAYAYAFDLIDEGSDSEFDELRKDNAKLKEDIDDLTRKLEKCQKNYEGLKNRVSWDEHKEKKGEVGGVSA
jgi:hypothetical protein